MKTTRVLLLVVVGLGVIGGLLVRAWAVGREVRAYLLAAEDAVDRWYDLWIHVEYSGPDQVLGWVEQLEQARAEFAALDAPKPAERLKYTVELGMSSVIELALAMGLRADREVLEEKMLRASRLSTMVDEEMAALKSRYRWWTRE